MEEEPNQCETCGAFECEDAGRVGTHLDDDGICEECQPAEANYGECPDTFTKRMSRWAAEAEDAQYDPNPGDRE